MQRPAAKSNENCEGKKCAPQGTRSSKKNSILWVEPKIKHASLVRSRQTIQNFQVFTGFSVQIQEGKQEKIKET